jgi:uncharacterized protein
MLKMSLNKGGVMKATALDKVVYLLLVVGGLNWGLVGAFEFNLVDTIFGEGSALSRVVYVVVGLAALYGIYALVSMLSSRDSTAPRV